MLRPEGYPRAIIWDLDGTLVESAPDIATALNILLNEQGMSGYPIPAVRKMGFYAIHNVAHQAANACDLNRSTQHTTIIM